MQSLGELQVTIGANTGPLKKAEKEVSNTTSRMADGFEKLGGAIAAVMTVETARQTILIADNMRRLEGTVKRLTETTGDFNKVWDEIASVSNENGTAIADTTALFQRFQTALENVTNENEDVLKFIDTLQKLGRIGGSSTEELSNALTQLSQGLSGGKIQAEEWNSIIDQAPEILKSVAKNIEGVNGDLGELRKLMLDGKLSAEIFYEALVKGAEDANEEFSKLPTTIDMASQKLSNNFALAVKRLDEQLGASKNIAKFIDWLGEEIKPPSELEQLENYAKAIQSTIEATKKNMNEPWYTGDGEARLKQLNADLEKTQEAIKKLSGGNKPLELEIKIPQLQGPLIGEDKSLDKIRESWKQQEEDALSSMDSIYLASLSQKDRLLALETQQLDEVMSLYEKGLISYEQYQNAVTQTGKAFAEQRVSIEDESIQAISSAYDALNRNIADSLAGALAGTQSWADAMRSIISNLASQLIEAGLGAAFGQQASAGNIFADIFAGAAGGGRAMGGQTSGMLAHPINERGTPEILEMSGRQYLLPTGKNGQISPMQQGGGNSQPNISMINMGTPMQVEGVQIDGNEIKLMINDAIKRYDNSLNSSLASGTGKTAKSLQQGYNVTRNLGVR